MWLQFSVNKWPGALRQALVVQTVAIGGGKDKHRDDGGNKQENQQKIQQQKQAEASGERLGDKVC